MDSKEFERQNLEESMAALGLTMEIRTFKLLYKPTHFQLCQTIAVNWMVEKEKSLAKSGWLADDCSTGKVRPCCAVEIYCSPH